MRWIVPMAVLLAALATGDQANGQTATPAPVPTLGQDRGPAAARWVKAGCGAEAWGSRAWGAGCRAAAWGCARS